MMDETMNEKINFERKTLDVQEALWGLYSKDKQWTTIWGGYDGETYTYAMGLHIDNHYSVLDLTEKINNVLNNTPTSAHEYKLKNMEFYTMKVYFDNDSRGRWLNHIYLISENLDVVYKIIDFLKKEFRRVRVVHNGVNFDIKVDQEKKDKKYIYL